MGTLLGFVLMIIIFSCNNVTVCAPYVSKAFRSMIQTKAVLKIAVAGGIDLVDKTLAMQT